jgi:hypothetical protein
VDEQIKIPTVFTDKKQRHGFMDPFNGNTKPIVKALVIVALILTLAAVIVTRDWSFMLRDTGQTVGEATVEVKAMRRDLEEVKRDYARKDVLEPRLLGIERGVDQLQEQGKENERLLRQILLDRARK